MENHGVVTHKHASRFDVWASCLLH